MKLAFSILRYLFHYTVSIVILQYNTAPISTDTQEAESKKRPYLSKNVFIYIINILPIQIVIPLDALHSKYHNPDQPLQGYSQGQRRI